MKFYLTIATFSILLCSCMKQSIADAMLDSGTQSRITANLSYEINGNLVALSVNDADNLGPFGDYKLACTKSGGYILNAREFTFTFFTDSLKVGSYNYLGSYVPMYVTDFQGRPQFVYFATDYMKFNIISYKDGRISGNFSGQITPLINSGIEDSYGDPSSVLIKNGSFNNVPIVY